MASQNFTATDTWQAPEGVTTVTVTARGGGAAGSPNGSAAARPGGGGGGGAYTKGTIDVTALETYTVTVGAAVSSGNGNPSSVVGDSLTVTANGGTGTTTRSGGAGGTTSSGGHIIASFAGGAGGTATNTNNHGGAGGGEGAGSTATGGDGSANSTSTGGAGGTGTDGADGGRGGDNNGANVTDGTAPGGGGGGAGGNSDTNGGGARGEVLLEWEVAVLPTVTTQAVSSIAQTTATGNGNVTSDGGETVTERGVVANRHGTPTTSSLKFQAASGGTGVYTASMTGLEPVAHYYVRAYAISSGGTGYGDQVEFNTLAVATTEGGAFNF